jgi:hypothetical protein
MPAYLYHELSDSQFEDLVIALCQDLLGIGVRGFAAGADGGRDASFEGNAELHPSRRSPWTGKTVIQAKHTLAMNGTYSDVRFFNPTNRNSVLVAETEKIKALREANRLDNYMLFSNRRLTAGREAEITDHIGTECDLPSSSITLLGEENLEALLRRFPHIPKQVKLSPFERPFMPTSREIAEIIEALASVEVPEDNTAHDPVDRIAIETKNRINNVDTAYFRGYSKRFLVSSRTIQIFLSNPQNQSLARKYRDAVDDIQLKYLAQPQTSESFVNVLEYLFDFYTGQEVVLDQNKALTRAILFHMYYFCDIGKSSDADSNEA